MMLQYNMDTYLLAFLQSKQHITTSTRRNKQADDMDQNATWIGESGSHQNYRNKKEVMNSYRMTWHEYYSLRQNSMGRKW